MSEPTPTPEPTPAPEPKTEPTPTPEPNPLQAKLDALQAKYDADIVARDKAIEAEKTKSAETQRRYEIAVKTGSKTPAQTGPAESANPVLDAINRRYPAKT